MVNFVTDTVDFVASVYGTWECYKENFSWTGIVHYKDTNMKVEITAVNSKSLHLVVRPSA